MSSIKVQFYFTNEMWDAWEKVGGTKRFRSQQDTGPNLRKMIHNTQHLKIQFLQHRIYIIHCMSKMQSYWTLQQVIHIINSFIYRTHKQHGNLNWPKIYQLLLRQYLARYTLLRHSCFIFLYCELFECTNCFEYGHAASPATVAVGTKMGLDDDPVLWVWGRFHKNWFLNFGSVRAQPVGFTARGNSSRGFRPYLNL